jgi:hypothetical protein
MDHGTELRPNPLYAELFGLLFTEEMNEHVLDDVMAEFYAFVDRHDPVDAMTAMGGGQRSHPTGTLYCGREPSWSTRNLQAMAEHYLQSAKKIALIDWHTGLGDFGKATVLDHGYTGAEAAAWAGTWWAGHGPNAELSDSAQPVFVGHASTGLADELRWRGATVAETVVELGTFANKGVLMALLIDRWLRFECKDRSAPHAVRLETQMKERLNPSNPEWREAVLGEMETLYSQTIAGLADWR